VAPGGVAVARPAELVDLERSVRERKKVEEAHAFYVDMSARQLRPKRIRRDDFRVTPAPEPTRAIFVFTLALGAHLEVRTEDDRIVVLVRLKGGGYLMPRWGQA
jgi:hypothetical protein